MKTQEEFNAREREWRSRLAGRSLVLEADIDPDQALEGLTTLGDNFRLVAGKSERLRLGLRYRATLLAGMCAVASNHYEDGTYWPNLPSGFRTDGDANRQAEMSNAFRLSLEDLGLSRFTTPLRNVGEILMHAGIPLQSMTRFALTLARWDAMQRAGDGGAFVAWARSMSRDVAVAKAFDVPTWRFLTEGGEIASDFVDRCLRAIDGSGSADGLPARVLQAIDNALSGSSPNRRVRPRRTTDIVPLIHYAPNEGVRVRLPPLEHGSDQAITWTVSSGGSLQRIEVPEPWPGSPVAPHWAGVRSPQRLVDVSVQPGDSRWTLELLSAEDPLLVFDAEDGTLVPPRNSLPKGRVWLGFPNTNGKDPIEVLETVGDLSIVERPQAPRGWEGWTFAGIDTAGLDRVRVLGLSERWRYVSTIDRPRLIGLGRMDFVETRDARPVSPVRPKLALPGPLGEGAANVTWLVEVVDLGGTVAVSTTHLVGPEGATVDPWGEVRPPVVGDYTVIARGPLGRGATLPVAVAEGFSVTSSTRFRLINSNGAGLVPATARLRGPDGDAFDQVVAFGPGDVATPSTFRSQAGALEVIVAIPHLEIEVVGVQDLTATFSPVALDREGLGGSTLRVRIPSDVRWAEVAALVGGEPLQTLRPLGQKQGGWRSFNLGELTSTLSSVGGAQLRLVIDDTSVPIAYVRPRELAASMTVSDGKLIVGGGAPAEGLVAFAYPTFAPWVGPVRLEFGTDGLDAALPPALLGEGRLTVTLQVENPWVPHVPPRLPQPSPNNVFVVEVGQLSDPSDAPEAGFRSWLAGWGPCPSHLAGLPTALTVYSLLPRLARPLGLDLDRARSELAAAVRANREHLMDAVLATEAQILDLLRLFVESDVVTVPREDWESSPLLWTLSPALGVIADSDERGGPRAADFMANVERFVGAAGVRILETGRDPHSSVGRFDSTAVLLAARPREQVDALWQAAHVVPTALLDKDSRADAAKQVFDVRQEKILRSVTAQTQELLMLASSALTRDLGPEAVAPIQSRRFQDGWADLPAVSIALALVARAAARGGAHSHIVYDRARQGYAYLAAQAPKMVEIDLCLAELWITRWEETR